MRSEKDIIEKFNITRKSMSNNYEFGYVAAIDWVLNGGQEQCSDSDSKDMLDEGWRDAEKVLPDDRRDVIIGNAKNKCVSTGWWNAEHNYGEGKWLIRTAGFDGEVTHWKELPEPPAFG